MGRNTGIFIIFQIKQKKGKTSFEWRTAHIACINSQLSYLMKQNH